jgi:hypothetical protein
MNHKGGGRIDWPPREIDKDPAQLNPELSEAAGGQ